MIEVLQPQCHKPWPPFFGGGGSARTQPCETRRINCPSLVRRMAFQTLVWFAPPAPPRIDKLAAMRFLAFLVSLAPLTGIAQSQDAVTACFADPSVTAHYCVDLTKKMMACKDRNCLCTQDMLNHIMW